MNHDTLRTPSSDCDLLRSELRRAFAIFADELADRIGSTLTTTGPARSPEGDLRPLNPREAADLTGLALGTIYSKVSRREIPFMRLGPRLVRFDRTELEAWMRAGRVAPKQ